MDDSIFGRLDLSSQGRLLLSLSISVDWGQYITTYKPIQIDAFIEGRWIEDFKAVQQEALARREQSELEWKNQRARELKDKFGL